ncbi:hypothetical protein SAMD00019534_029660, partial [Acytostelium subglobosum LB1]|uniref:hypothetical protein n=1 Tax=Acytostelium subglobosum LB1 TaxID=1410327 RepID=UPI0006451BCE
KAYIYIIHQSIMSTPAKPFAAAILDRLKAITDKVVEDLGYCIENNVAEEEDDNSTMSPLVIPFTQSTSKTKLVGQLQKVAKSWTELTASLNTLSRSAMIINIRTMCDLLSAMNNDVNAFSTGMPDGKAKLKFLEHVSKLKSSSVQLKITISVRASSDGDDNLTDTDKKLESLYETMGEAFDVITHSDRVFNDLDFKQTSSSSTWNTISWN